MDDYKNLSSQKKDCICQNKKFFLFLIIMSRKFSKLLFWNVSATGINTSNVHTDNDKGV